MPATFTRASDAYDPLLGTTVASNVRRRRPVYVDGALLPPSQWADLVEGQRENICTYSEDVSNWEVSGTVSGVTADTFYETNTSGFHGVRRQPTMTNTIYVFSLEVKKIGTEDRRFSVELYGTTDYATRYFDLSQDGTGGDSSDVSGYSITRTLKTNIGGGWYRLEVVFDCTSETPIDIGMYLADASADLNYAGLETEGVQVRKMQVEACLCGIPSTYIKTLASPVTRAADSLTGTLPNIGTSGTLIVAGKPILDTVNYAPGNQPRLFSANNGDLGIRKAGASGMRFNVNDATNQFYGVNDTTESLNANFVHAFTFRQDGANTRLRIYRNGTQLSESTGAGLTLNTINGQSYAIGSTLSALLQSNTYLFVAIYDRVLSQSEIIALHNSISF
jgi:hypothetical protein